MDTHDSVLDYFYTRLTTDDTLKSLMGGTVRVYSVWAEPDAVFPYLVHKADIRNTEFFPVQTGTYYLDIWSHDYASTEILNIRARLMTLLDELKFDTTELYTFRLTSERSGFVPETEEKIWHYALTFSFRFYRKTEAATLL